jgi:hypothetical protein
MEHGVVGLRVSLRDLFERKKKEMQLTLPSSEETTHL